MSPISSRQVSRRSLLLLLALLAASVLVYPVKEARAATIGGWLGVYRPSNVTFYTDNDIPPVPERVQAFGYSGDIPVMHDGFYWLWVNGKKVGTVPTVWVGVFHAGQWTFSNGGSETYGMAGDTPLCGNWDGLGYDNVGVKRGNSYYLRLPGDGDDKVFAHGSASDVPIVGDWDGDGDDSIGLYRPSTRTFYLNNYLPPSGPNITFQYGIVGDRPVAGDWNKDGIDTVGVVRGNTWYLKNSHSGGSADTSFSFGKATDVPLSNSY